MKKLTVRLALVALTVFSFQPLHAQKSVAPVLKFGDPLPANAFVELAKLINPAVVNISTTTLPKQQPRRPGYGRDPFFDMLEEMYGLRMNPGMAKPQQALGTGFIIREDGLIVTNNHVIAGADTINVQLSEKTDKIYEAKLIGSDERTDIALIKITADVKLPVAQLGSSKDSLVGEWVAAFGNPLGQGHTMTKGIISAIGREIGEINKFPLIQTDAPINPGNSGGPLVNMKGYVIGVNSAIAAGAQGIGFAIPIDELKEIIPQLEKDGRVKKGYLGVGLDMLNPQAAEYLGMKEALGALVVNVENNTPASRAGIKPYDVITEFNGKKIEDPRDLTNAVADSPIGKKVNAKLFREGKVVTAEVHVTERPLDPKLSAATRMEPKKYFGQKAPFDLGFVVTDINADVVKNFSLDKRTQGVVVIEVDGRSPSALGGIRPGDVILDVNKKEIKNSKDLLKNIKKGMNTFRIKRGPGVAIVTIEA